jgi:hypothetical protein
MHAAVSDWIGCPGSLDQASRLGFAEEQLRGSVHETLSDSTASVSAV